MTTLDEKADTASQPLAELIGADVRVPLVHGDETRYVNLDYAASAPSLVQVAKRVAEVLPWYSSVHRGSGYLSLVSTSLYESARATVHTFVDGREDDVVIFTRNTTDGLNLLAGAVPDDGEVLYLDTEHHADLLPWQRRANRCVSAGRTLAETLERLTAAFEERPAALVAVAGASNVTGEILPIGRIAHLAHDYGARIVVDAAQLAPHRRISLRETEIDYVAFSGHKCYAPFGAGVLVGRRDWLDRAPAYLAGGGAVERVTIEETHWAVSPERHEGGTPNVIGAVALAEASLVLGELTSSGAIDKHDHALRTHLLDKLDKIEKIRTLRVWEDSDAAIGIVSFDVIGHDAALVSAYLSAEHGIGVRDGKFCAHPLIERINGGRSAIRASFGLGTTTDDLDRLGAALTDYLEHGPSRSYLERDGWFAPRGDERPTPFPEVNLQDPVLAPPCQSFR